MKVFQQWFYVSSMLIAPLSIALSVFSQSDVASFIFKDPFEVCEEFQRAVWLGDLEKIEIIYKVKFLRVCIGKDHISNALRAAALRGHTNIIRYLLCKGVDANQRVLSNGGIALHDAAKVGSVDVIDCLVAAGGDVNRTSINGFTPLHYAVRGGSGEAVKRLIGHGADMHAQNQHGKTPLQTATELWRTSWGQDRQILLDIIRYMVPRGAPLAASDSDVIDAIYKTKHTLGQEQEAVGKALEDISNMTGLPRDLNRLLLSFLSAHLRIPNLKISTSKQKLRGCLDAMISFLYAWSYAR